MKLYLAHLVVSPSVKLKIQYPDWLLTQVFGVITNWFPFNVQVAKEQETKVAVIVSQLPAVTHISVITFDIVVVEVIVHKFFVGFGTFKSTSLQRKFTDADVAFPTPSLTDTEIYSQSDDSLASAEYNV